MAIYRYQLIDMAGGEIGIINDERPLIQPDEQVQMPDGSMGTVVEIYDDENGMEGNVQATLVIEE